jgi:hypothetical protein
MRKKLSLITAIAVLASMLFVSSAFAKSEINVLLNGETLSFKPAPFMEGGNVIVPLKPIAEKLGAQVIWDKKTKTVWVNSDYMNIQFFISKKTVYIFHKYDFSGKPQKVEIPVPAKLINDTTYVPVRFISETLGLNVTWDKNTRTVVIKDASSVTCPTKLLDFNKITSADIQDNAKFKAWYESIYKKEGTYFIADGNETYIMASAGEKPTGGYSVVIDYVTMGFPGKVQVSARLFKPAPGVMVPQMVTYPNALVKLDRNDIKEVIGEIKDDADNSPLKGYALSIDPKDIKSIKLASAIDTSKIKELDSSEFIKIAGFLNTSKVDESPYIEMITGNRVEITFNNGSEIELLSYGSTSNIIANGMIDGKNFSLQLIAPDLAKMLLDKF